MATGRRAAAGGVSSLHSRWVERGPPRVFVPVSRPASASPVQYWRDLARAFTSPIDVTDIPIQRSRTTIRVNVADFSSALQARRGRGCGPVRRR